MNNADLLYRPLIAGVSVMNERMGEPGTLGYVARDMAGQMWIVSAYHVLVNNDLSAFGVSEVIYQPAAPAAENAVAATSALKASVALDCAAALVNAGVVCGAGQLGIGVCGVPTPPAVGMRVMKSGADSGITEGFITDVTGDRVTIETDPSYDVTYTLSAPGDSGSLWIEQKSRNPVALHRGHTTARKASATNFLSVLAALNLQPL